MGPWLIFLRERFPFSSYALLAGGFVLSGQSIAMSANVGIFTAAFVLVILFFAELRLMDELKDYAKDQIANPTRPLPRGVLSPRDVKRAMVLIAVVMFVASLLCFRHSPRAAGLYALVSGYLWLMFAEFFIGSWLEKKPLLYASSHQIILIPLCLFSVFVFTEHPSPGAEKMAWGWSLLVLASFFSYEVCRKLDPKAHPILKTYLSVYGEKGCALILAGLLPIGVLGMWVYSMAVPDLSLLSFVLPFLSLAGFIAVYASVRSPKKHKLMEAIATLSLALNIWFPFLAKVL